MNVIKYIWLKVKGYFNPPIETHIGTFEDLKNSPRSGSLPWSKGGREEYEDWCNKRAEEAKATFPPDLPPKEKDPARWEINEEKLKRPYNRATKQQVARIKVLVGRGKTAKQIAKDVGLPYDNVNYYVKKFGG